MGVVMVLAGLGLVALPGLARSLGRRLAPSRWAALALAAIVIGGGVFELGLLAYAAPTVLRALGVPALASACERMLGALVPGGALVGWAAAALGVLVAGLAARGFLSGRRFRRVIRAEPCLGEHRPLGDHQLVVLPGKELLALSVAGRPGQVIVSSGLVAVLPDAELAMVVAHEVAHLEYGHQRYLALAGVLEAALVFFPPARKSVAALHSAVERWADEAAIREAHDRIVLRHALLQVTQAAVGVEVAAFSAADTVAERLEALQARPTPLRTVSLGLLYSPGLVLGIASVAGGAAWLGGLRMLFEMAGRCPL